MPWAKLGKSLVFTSCGFPFGRHVRPPILKGPTNSFFLASTEITVPPGVQQLAQHGFDLMALGGLAIQLCHQIQHHLLQDLRIFREMLGVDNPHSKAARRGSRLVSP